MKERKHSNWSNKLSTSAKSCKYTVDQSNLVAVALCYLSIKQYSVVLLEFIDQIVFFPPKSNFIHRVNLQETKSEICRWVKIWIYIIQQKHYFFSNSTPYLLIGVDWQYSLWEWNKPQQMSEYMTTWRDNSRYTHV